MTQITDREAALLDQLLQAKDRHIGMSQQAPGRADYLIMTNLLSRAEIDLRLLDEPGKVQEAQDTLMQVAGHCLRIILQLDDR